MLDLQLRLGFSAFMKAKSLSMSLYADDRLGPPLPHFATDYSAICTDPCRNTFSNDYEGMKDISLVTAITNVGNRGHRINSGHRTRLKQYVNHGVKGIRHLGYHLSRLLETFRYCSRRDGASSLFTDRTLLGLAI